LEQEGEFRQLFCLCELLEDAAQKKDAQDVGGCSQWWSLRTQGTQPADGVRIAPEVFQGPNARIMLTEIKQEAPGSAAVDAFGSRAEWDTDDVDSARE
jgi:hypothetical protein